MSAEANELCIVTLILLCYAQGGAETQTNGSELHCSWLKSVISPDIGLSIIVFHRWDVDVFASMNGLGNLNKAFSDKGKFNEPISANILNINMIYASSESE